MKRIKTRRKAARAPRRRPAGSGASPGRTRSGGGRKRATTAAGRTRGGQAGRKKVRKGARKVRGKTASRRRRTTARATTRNSRRRTTRRRPVARGKRASRGSKRVVTKGRRRTGQRDRRVNLALRRRHWWADLPDEQLLDLRFCDLKLRLTDGPLAPALARLDHEMERRGLRFRPHTWLSVEWFSPDGVPGIAIPFYLAHPRLARLERQQMHEVEGGNARWLQRILRHEAGHAIDTAYRLRRRKRWRQIFGPASRPYPIVYRPRTTSRSYVLHLGHWYAQSHPTEDFAETFAVWLTPNSTWRSDYAGWPAMRKLHCVDALMQETAPQRPVVRNRDVIEPLTGNRRTLRAYYREKSRYYQRTEPSRYDDLLGRVFAPREDYPHRPPAAAFIRHARPKLRRLLVRRARLHPYLVHHVMRLVIRRVRELDLCVHRPVREAERATLRLLERLLFDFLRRGRERYAL
jgi:hypothetical protein